MPEGLYDIAASEGVGIEFAFLPRPLLGLYDRRPGEPPIILLHERLKKNRKMLRCIVAEELGHHYTSAGNLLAFARSDKARIVLKQEKLALWWATQHLIPLDRLCEAIAKIGIFSTHELAEYFDVTERFMATAIRFYYEKKGDWLIKRLKKLPDELISG